MRETVSEKIRQNFIGKSSPNLFWQEIRQKVGLSREAVGLDLKRTVTEMQLYSNLISSSRG